MKLSFRVRLSIALVASALPILLPAPVSAQNAAPKPRQVFSEAGLAESVDAAAKTVSIRRAQLQPNQQFAENDLLTFELAPSFKAERTEFDVAARDLKIGDTVSLVSPRADDALRATGAQPSFFERRSESKYRSGVTWMQVVSLSPLTLRQGTLPEGVKTEDGRKSVVSNGPYSFRDIIGVRWSGTGREPVKRTTSLQLNSRGEVAMVTNESVTTYVQTVQITKPEGLKFDRFIPMTFAEAARDAALDKVCIFILERSPDGKYRVRRLHIWDKD